MIHKKLLSLLVLLMTAATGAWADKEPVLLTTILATENTDWDSSKDFNNGKVKGHFSMGVTNNGQQWNFVGMAAQVTITAANGYTITSCKFFINNSPTEVTNASFIFTGPLTKVEVYGYENDPEVTFNEDSTEASFTMPAKDVTVSYELVRDMSVSMTTKVGDAADGADYRIRVKKDGDGKWELADMGVQDLLGMITVHDGIEDKNLKFFGDEAVCSVSIYALDDQGQTASEATSYQNLMPGRYVAVATAKDGTVYDGQTPASNVIVIFQGYEVEVAAGEFATFYAAENTVLSDATPEGISRYTITDVSTDNSTVTLAALSGIVAGATPMLVYNGTDDDQTVILMRTTDAATANNVDIYTGFKGTLVASTIAASTNDQTNYALNGKQFVWVKNALSIAANKCWLEVVNSNARAISIMFNDEETTGISTAVTTVPADGDWYDLNGRKVTAPTRKGIYIQNGKKVVVK